MTNAPDTKKANSLFSHVSPCAHDTATLPSRLCIAAALVSLTIMDSYWVTSFGCALLGTNLNVLLTHNTRRQLLDGQCTEALHAVCCRISSWCRNVLLIALETRKSCGQHGVYVPGGMCHVPCPWDRPCRALISTSKTSAEK